MLENLLNSSQKACKLTVQFLSGRAVRLVGFFRSVVAAEMCLLLIDHYHRLIASAFADHSLEACLIVGANLLVAGVFLNRSQPQVAATIIQRVPIDVIHYLPGLGIHEYAMHLDEPVSLNRVVPLVGSGIKRSICRLAVSFPAMGGKPSKVLIVNNRLFSLSKRNRLSHMRIV